MNSKMFYLGSPYSHKSKRVMREKEQKVTKLAAKLHTAGITVYPPVTVSSRLAKYVKSRNISGFNEWKQDDLTFLYLSSGLIVYMLKGWQDSIGLTVEIEFAKVNNIPVYYLNEVISNKIFKWFVEKLKRGNYDFISV